MNRRTALWNMLLLATIGCNHTSPSIPKPWISPDDGSGLTGTKNSQRESEQRDLVIVNGFPLRLVIAETVSLHVAPHNGDTGANTGKSLNLFDIVYVRELSTGNEYNFPNQWVRVSYSRGGDDSAWMYVTATNSFPWAHRVAFLPMQMNNSLRTLPIYESFEDCRDAFAGKGVSPIGEFTLSRPDRRVVHNPWPILEQREFDGKVAYRAAMVGQRQGAQAGSAYTKQEVEAMRRELRTVDVMVAIDATGSMGRWMNAAKSAIQNFVAVFDSQGIEARFSLSFYRDMEADGSEWYGHWQLESASEFVRRLGSVQAGGGGYHPEQESGYPALIETLNRTKFRPKSERMLLVVGDGDFAESGRINPKRINNRDVITTAKSSHTKVFVLAAGDNTRLAAQIDSIARQTGGKTFVLSSTQALIGEMATILRQGASEVDSQTRVFDGLRDGKSIERIAVIEGKSISEITHIVNIFDKVKNVDTARLASGAPVALTGWIVPSVAGVSSGIKEVHLFRIEAEEILKVMQTLLRASPDMDFSVAIWKGAKDSRIRNEPVGNFFEDNFLPYRSTSILSLSLEEIKNLPEANRARIQDELLPLIRQLDLELKEEARWVRLSDGRIAHPRRFA